MLGHALCHGLSFHSQTLTHSVTNNQSYYQNNQSYYQNNQSYWKIINPTTDLLSSGKIYCSNTTQVNFGMVIPLTLKNISVHRNYFPPIKSFIDKFPVYTNYLSRIWFVETDFVYTKIFQCVHYVTIPQ